MHSLCRSVYADSNKKGIRITVGISFITVSSVLFQVMMQIINVIIPIYLFFGFLLIGEFTLSAQKFVEFLSFVMTAPFVIIGAIVSAPFLGVMLSLDYFWKEGKTFKDFHKPSKLR